MRADMAKVIVERPRFKRGSTRKPKGAKRRIARCGEDGPPGREGIRRPWDHARKCFNEHLGPLRRYLDKQVGRPWDKVHSEICANLRRDSVVQDHVRDHVDGYVLRDVILIDGVPCHGSGYWIGRPLKSTWYRWYVCPRTGLLRRVKRPSRKRKSPTKPEGPPPFISLGDYLQCRCSNGGWHLVTLRRLPADGNPRLRSTALDIVLDLPVAKLSDEVARQEYGSLVYAVECRPIARHELSQYPIPVRWWR